MGAPLSTNKATELKTVSLKVLVVGGESSGKSSVIHRYIANQFSLKNNKEPPETKSNAGSQQLPEQLTHTLKVPGRKEVVSVTFWEIPSNPLPFMKEQYYTCADAVVIVVDGSQESDHSSTSDHDVSEVMVEDSCEITMREAQVWKTDILDNSLCTPQDLPMMVLVNERETETESLEQNDNREFEVGMDQEQLSDLAVKKGFTSCLSVQPHLGNGSVLRAVDSLLRLLLERSSINQRLANVTVYPTQSEVAALCGDPELPDS